MREKERERDIEREREIKRERERGREGSSLATLDPCNSVANNQIDGLAASGRNV